MSYMIQGVQAYEDERGKHVAFDAGLNEQTFTAFLEAMMREGLELSLYDPRYPSPSDPGAYLSYSPGNHSWRMTLGNHGWSGGIYEIRPSIVARQLYSLYISGQLHPLHLDRVAFFEHLQPESQAANEEMNRLLEKLHA